MPDSNFNFGHFVSDFVHSLIPTDPITPQGLLVSDFVHDLHLHIPPNPISPGNLVSDFVHSIPPDPITPQGQIVNDFVHELHHPTTTLIGLGADPGFLIT